MTSASWLVVCVVGAGVSPGRSCAGLRLERLGERAGMSEALLGMVAALAADARRSLRRSPRSRRSGGVGAGVVIGSNIFNLAALLGLGAVVAGRIGLHRRVVWLSGSVAVWVARVHARGARPGPPLAGLVLVAVVLAPYIRARAAPRAAALPLPASWTRWLAAAVHEEELELEEAIGGARAPGVTRW